MFDNYAPVHELEDIKEEIKTKANQYDFNGVYFSIDSIKKELDNLLLKETFNKKFTELRQDLERKIGEKVNTPYLKKVEKTFTEKFIVVDGVLKTHQEGITILKTSSDMRNNEGKRELMKLHNEIAMKMERAEAGKLWQHLKRFPFYEDLKDLNDKFLPELAKFQS